MKIIKIQTEDKTYLQALLSKVVSSFTGKYVSFSIQSHSGNVGTVLMTISGKRGVVQKHFAILRLDNDPENFQWSAYANGYEYKLKTITEFSTVIKSQIQLALTILTKI